MTHLFRLFMAGGLVAAAILIVAVGLARHDANLLAPVNLLLLLVGLAIYLLPAALALYRECESALWITLINVFLGWTVFGWIIAIGWAAGGKSRPLPPRMIPPSQPLPGH